MARRWHDLAWRDKLTWAIDRALWNERPAANERSESLRATLDACHVQIDAARASRSTAESIAASRALVSRVRAFASQGSNSMMFTADADEALDAETLSSAFDDDGRDASSSGTHDDAASAAHTPLSGGSDAQTDALTDTDDAMPASDFATDAGNRPLMSMPFTTSFDRIVDLTGQGDANARCVRTNMRTGDASANAANSIGRRS